MKVDIFVFSWYASYWRVEYPLPKLDLMHEARKGMAMENWGLVLFTPRTLLLDTDTATEEDTWTVLSLLTHELAHQVKL